MKKLSSAFAIGPCIIMDSHLIKPAKNKKFGSIEYSVVALADDKDANTLQTTCEELIERAFADYTPAERYQVRIPGDYDDRSGRIRFRMKLRPEFGKPEVCDRDGTLITLELPNCSTAILAGKACVYCNNGGGVWLAVTHVVVEQLVERAFTEVLMKALDNEKAPAIKPGQTFIEYIQDKAHS